MYGSNSVVFFIIMPKNFFSMWSCLLGSNRKRKESSPTEKNTRLDVTLYLILSRTNSTRTQRTNKLFKQTFVALKSCSSICCRAKTCYKRVPHSQVFKNRKWTYGLQKQTYIRDSYFTMTAEWSLKFLYWIIRIMTVNGSMSCHNITAFRMHPTLCFPVLRNTKSAGLKMLAFLICKTCLGLLCIFMSKSSSNTMGFQLFNVLFIKVGGTPCHVL